MSASQPPLASSDHVDEAQSEMIDIYHRPNESSQYSLLYRAPKDMLTSLSPHFHFVLIEQGKSAIHLTSGERAAFLGIFKWLSTFWTTSRQDSLHMGPMSIYKYMRLRYMSRKLDCPALTEFIASSIAFLLKCGMSIDDMDTILEWTANGDEDWDVVAEYAATELFKRRAHMDDYYDLFEKYGGFLDDVKMAVQSKRDERDDKVPPPDPDDDFYKQRTYWDFLAEQKKQQQSDVENGGAKGGDLSVGAAEEGGRCLEVTRL